MFSFAFNIYKRASNDSSRQGSIKRPCDAHVNLIKLFLLMAIKAQPDPFVIKAVGLICSLSTLAVILSGASQSSEKIPIGVNYLKRQKIKATLLLNKMNVKG